MQITCEHKLACSWLAASELDNNLFIYLLFIYLFIYLVTHKTLYNVNKSC